MPYEHGVYVSETATAITPAPSVDASLPYVVGGVPVAFGPSLVSSWSQFLSLSGISSEADYTPESNGWFKYSLVSFAYYWFRIAGRGECIMCGLADNPSSGVSTLTQNAILDALDLLGTIYERFRREPSLVLVPYYARSQAIWSAMASLCAQYGGQFSAMALADIPCGPCHLSAQSADVIDDPDDVVTAKTANDPYLTLCWPYVGVDTMRFDMSTVLAATMNRVDGQNAGLPFVSPSNKTCGITGLYVLTGHSAKASADLTWTWGTIHAAAKEPGVGGNSLTVMMQPYSQSAVECTIRRDSTTLFSTTTATMLSDMVNDYVDFTTSSTASIGTIVTEVKTVTLTGGEIVVPVEKPLFMNRDQVNNSLNGNGVVGARNTAKGWVIWGNNTSAYPGNLDIKDYMIPIRRTFNYTENLFMVWAETRIDDPLNRRQLEGVCTSFNQILAGLQGLGCFNSASIALDDEKNTLSDLLRGKVYFKIFISPPPPLQTIVGGFEYDVAGFEASLA